MIPEWASIAARVLTVVWVTNGVILLWCRQIFNVDTTRDFFAVPRLVLSELRPLYLPAALLLIADDSLRGNLFHTWTLVGDACSIWNWFLFKDEGDDRWKRRRKKVTEKVKALASGRLVAVPVGASR